MLILKIALPAVFGVLLLAWAVRDLLDPPAGSRYHRTWVALELIFGVIAIAAALNVTLLAAAGVIA